jgi:asparagine synthase (glutamine-hydrolysing)
MCGIAGRLETRASGAAEFAPLLAMLREMRPRGPDDSGTAEIRLREGGRLLLGACRLAILDLSAAGHQPMRDETTGNWLAYNGEIFNFRELRSELESRGCRFRSNCDTEVLLLGYRVWGEGVVQRLRGMFAFALWDEREQKVLLVRDRLGIKPLYFTRSAQQFAFASELRALLESGLVSRELDPTGVDSYLKFGAVQEPATIVRGIELLPAGHLLRWGRGEIKIERYWRLPTETITNGHAKQRQRAIDDMHTTLAEAVRMRLVSDVPLGVFLSSGLDSSVVAALAREATPDLRTFTISFEEQRLAEGRIAQRIAQHLGTRHSEATLSQRSILSELPQALQAMDQPTVDGVNTFFVSKLTKQAGVTVALSGLGGDELFAGYRSFRVVPQMERLNRWTPRWSRHLAGSLLDSRFLGARGDGKLGAFLRCEDGFAFPFFLARLVLTPRRVAQLLLPEWVLRIDHSVFRPQWQKNAQEIATCDPINRVAYLELSTYLRNMLLRDADCMSMAHSLEVRVPLIDHVLVEKMMRLPGAWKLARGQRKPLLTSALANPLPQDVLRLPKRGFEFPWGEWLRGELRAEVEQTLAQPGALAPALQWDRVQGMWREFQAGRLHWSRVWMFYVLRKWTEQHIGQ